MGRLAIDVAVFRLAVVNLPRLIRKFRADIFGIVLNIFAQTRYELTHFAQLIRNVLHGRRRRAGPGAEASRRGRRQAGLFPIADGCRQRRCHGRLCHLV